MRRLASTAAIVLIGVAGVAPLASAAETWVRVESPHFLLVGNAPEARIKSIARDLERFRAAMVMLMPDIGDRLRVGTTVVVFKDDAAFRPYKPQYQGKPANIAGYFQPGPDVNFIALDGEIQTPSVIYHEFAHRLIADATSRLPLWANEGLAEFYSTFRADASGRWFELGSPIDRHVLLLGQQASLAPLDTLLAVERDSPYYNEGAKQGIFYAESWALIHYLMAGDNGVRQPQLSRYLALVAHGTPIDRSFQEAFQADYQTMEKDLRAYVRRFTMTYFKVTPATKLDVDSTLRTVPISEAQAAAYRGELLVRQGRDDAAEQELQKAIALDGGNAGAYKALGLLRLRQKSHEEALEYLTKAVDSNSADYLSHFYFAQLLEELAGDEGSEKRRARYELMRTHVNKAIELAPDFLESYGLLAYVALMLNDGLAPVEQVLIKVTRDAPGREDLQLRLAQVMMASGKDAAARTIVSSVRTTTTNADMRRRTEELQEDLQTRIDSAQALRDYEARGAAAPAQQPSPSPPPPGDAGTALRPTPRAAGLRVEGMLVNIDCRNGMTLEVRTARGIVQLHSDTPGAIKFVSFVPIATDAIGCGPLLPEAYVSVVYQITDNPVWLGEPTVVEFRPNP